MQPRKHRNFKAFLIIIVYLFLVTAISEHFGLNPWIVMSLTIAPVLAIIILIFAGLVQGIKHLDQYEDDERY
jgi:predicted RND superfamily exporter protein